MNNIKASVIIPVFNVEQYLDECINSVLTQTEKGFEVILVDDGSSDSCSQKCDQFKQNDKRVKVIHKENGGLMSAWMRGVEESVCDYIIFVDSDDWIAPHMFEKMYAALEDYSPDIVICNMCKVSDNKKIRSKICFEKGYYSEDSIQANIYPIMLNAGDFQKRGLLPSRWGKLIKKQLIVDNFKYCDKRISFGEDLNIIFPCFLDCKSLVILDDEDCDYFYRTNPNSILQSYNSKMYAQICLLYPRLWEACKEKKRYNFEEQLSADYLAAMVQCYKNELMNPKGYKDIKLNISNLVCDEQLINAIRTVKWKHYRKLNVVIIYSMGHWNHISSNIITFFLYLAKRYRVKRLRK